jgi:hypothetical protein
MIIHVAMPTVITETFDDVANREEAIRRFVSERGFESVEEAAEHEGLTEDEFRQSLMITERRVE